MRHFLAGFLFFVILLGVSCSSSATSPVSEQLAQGKIIYEKGCATSNCHGTDGEGLRSGNGFRAWPLVGEAFQRRNPTAQVIFDVVRSGGESSLRALTDQQIYDSIAYELSLNGLELTEPLNSQNAPATSSGSGAATPNPGELFPPPGNADLISTWTDQSLQSAFDLPISVENGNLRLRLTQIALATFIGGKAPASGGSYVLMVLTFEDLDNKPLEVGPQYLSLVTGDGRALAPWDIGLAYPVDRFHSQIIQPDYGTVALVIFALPESAGMGHLLYTLQDREQLILALTK